MSSGPSTKQRADPWGVRIETMPMSITGKITLVVVLLLTTTWLSLFVLQLPGAHFFRIFGASAGAFLCFWSLAQLVHQRRASRDATTEHQTDPRQLKPWDSKTALLGMSVGCAMTIASWWLIPETETHRTLLRASAQHRQAVRHLADSDAVATDDFRAAAEERAELQRAFPQFRESIEAAERNWLERSVSAAIGRSRQLLDQTPLEASQLLGQFASDLEIPLGFHEDLEQKLRTARQEAYAASFRRVREETRSLLLADEFVEAREVASERASLLAREADRLGESRDLRHLVQTYEYIADVAMRAGQDQGE